MIAAEPDAPIDARDVLIGFAPFVDCAQRLGVDPISLFEAAAKDSSPAMRDLAATFARRSDVTLKDFGWKLDELPEGPCYRPEMSSSLWQSRGPSTPSASRDKLLSSQAPNDEA
jgi:hypothetical protein